MPTMGSVNSHETLTGLIRLQTIDDEIYRIRRRLDDGPQLVERRGDKFRQTEDRVSRAQDKVTRAKAAVGDRELDLKSKEEEIKKLLGQQATARTNQEYRALGDHAERLKQECSDLEDQILEAFGDVETAEGELKEVQAILEEHRAEKETFESQWNVDKNEYVAELQVHETRRNEHCQSLPEPALEIYERVLKARDGEAVVPVSGKVCSGCQMTIRPNDLARLQGGRDLVNCQSCERILYVAEVHGSVG